MVVTAVTVELVETVALLMIMVAE
jgi:hypothetical protein